VKTDTRHRYLHDVKFNTMVNTLTDSIVNGVFQADELKEAIEMATELAADYRRLQHVKELGEPTK